MMSESERKIGIYVFSGTGNTLKCAEALKAELLKLGVSACLNEIKDGTETARERELVICYPVYGFNMPSVLKRFCNALPRGAGIWFLKTSGEPLRLNDASSLEMIRILRKNGCEAKGEFHYVMPYNMVFRHTDELASLMWKTARERVPEAARSIAEGGSLPISPGPAARAAAALCRIEHGFYKLNGRFFRVDPAKCVRCMKCARDCPTGNISFSAGRFTFGKSCTGCVRCSFRCPADAIRIGLLNPMRVNGPYDFTRDPAKAKLGRYCRRAYKRYFAGTRPED